MYLLFNQRSSPQRAIRAHLADQNPLPVQRLDLGLTAPISLSPRSSSRANGRITRSITVREQTGESPEVYFLGKIYVVYVRDRGEMIYVIYLLDSRHIGVTEWVQLAIACFSG